jgi:hypothetical protein
VVIERDDPSRARPADAPDDARDPVDEAIEQTFPGSDPPAWTPSHAGAPGEHPDDMRPDRPRP